MTLRSIRHTALTVLAALAAMTAGCRHSDDPILPVEQDPESQPDPDMLTLCLSVKFDLQEDRTRALNDGQYEGADKNIGFENISSLRVIILSQSENDPNFGIVEANRMVTTSDEGHPKYDNLEFKVKADDNKRVFLIANESSLTAPTGFDGTASEFLNSFVADVNNKVGVSMTPLIDWTVSMPGIKDGVVTNGIFSDSKAVNPRLPLTEIFDLSTDRLEDSEVDNIYYTHMFITRAAAKASFYLDSTGTSPAYDNVSITGISLTGIGSMEYVFPKDTEYSIDKYKYTTTSVATDKLSASNLPINSNFADRYITGFASPVGCQPLTYSIPLDKPIPVVGSGTAADPARISGPIYFPESILATGERYMVSVTLSTGITLTAPLTDNILKVNNVRDAIARSTHLKVVLGFNPLQLGLEATVTVFPYTAVNLNPEFGFTPPETDSLVIAPELELNMSNPGLNALLTATFTSTEGNTIQNLYWVSSNPEVVLLGNEVTDETDVRYVEPSESIELPYLQMIQDKEEPVPVRVVPQQAGWSDVAVYTESGLVARCRVTVKK